MRRDAARALTKGCVNRIRSKAGKVRHGIPLAWATQATKSHCAIATIRSRARMSDGRSDAAKTFQGLCNGAERATAKSGSVEKRDPPAWWIRCQSDAFRSR